MKTRIKKIKQRADEIVEIIRQADESGIAELSSVDMLIIREAIIDMQYQMDEISNERQGKKRCSMKSL